MIRSRILMLVATVALVLATTGCTNGGPDQSGVFVTRDAGTNWLATPDLTNKETKKPKVYPPLAVTAIGASPIDPNFVVAGTDDDLYMTTDGGGGWTKLTDRLPTAGKAVSVQAVHFHPRDPDTFYVTGVSAGYGKILRSTDRGATLTDIFTVSRPGQTVTSILVDATDPQVILAGDQLGSVYRSGDAGTTWRRVFATDGNPVSSLAQSGQEFYAGTVGSGVFRSTDRGGSFSPVNANLTGAQLSVWRLAGGLGAMYAGSQGGLLVTRDFGASWQEIGNPLTDTRAPVQGLAISGNNVFFATNAVIYRTNANGDSFLPVQLKLAKNIFDLAATPADPSVLYAAANSEAPFLDRFDKGQAHFLRIAQ